MKLLSPVVISIVAALTFPGAQPNAQGADTPGPRPLLGFDAASSAAQLAVEARFDRKLDPSQLRSWMKVMTARPHHIGSPYGKYVADYIAQEFKSWGYETTIETFHVLFPTPRTRVVELLAPVHVRLGLDELALKEDATSAQKNEQLPTYHVYAADGDVQGPLVYVNYGVPKDYEELDRRGIDVRGKIVLVRYGGSWRGIKPKVAAEHGAVGCIIYSDPRDDGFFQGEAYPKGAFRNQWSAQRGSVMDLPVATGDPLTPGVAATHAAKRLDRKDAPTLMKIPVLPISWGDALPLLKALGGPVAPTDWRGALPVTYHIGPGPAVLHMKLAFDWKLVPAYDVIARLTGTVRPDEWVIRANHHDAWVYGAEDPISGLVALMAEARAIGDLARTGWRPRRTIVFAAWDGEEQGLLGSTEWAEAHADELREKAVAYVNSDSNGRGFLDAGGSHTLEPFVAEIAREVKDPQRGISVAERRRAYDLVHGSPDERTQAAAQTGLRLSALGSGSDFTPFLQNLGIASLNLGFGGESEGGSYHSIYDSFDHYTRFGDPDFRYGVALAQVAGRAVLRLANADTLPLDFGAFADTVGRYVTEVTKLCDDLRTEAEAHNKLVADGTLLAAADPKEALLSPKTKPVVPFVNFAPLHNALARLHLAAGRYRRAQSDHAKAGMTLSPDARARLNTVLRKAERALTRPDGLPQRSFYRHQIYAPGFYTGYGVKTLPGVREAIEEHKWRVADEQIARAATTLGAFAAEIDRATAAFSGS